uniref:Uncharacterized protein n=1 Tax=Chromera velia CCMP2878 TaxID=1169474 RepID=A0A0G4H391_9ALVE|eukprot:Cvel_24461.t1-p1 / transcript=Cvel_24461.t1 / gene=Cvel_24461 / organism=Chromera_velia_CCMP2878 / gene_product=hypothetical protein / transcript_product=hypothetical protein / location=Cvel_scaffold2646:9231-14293(+) / protein_length=880 / sequence_SO=supercontig / SO=protein_coding / is_pseudo=false
MDDWNMMDFDEDMGGEEVAAAGQNGDAEEEAEEEDEGGEGEGRGDGRGAVVELKAHGCDSGGGFLMTGFYMTAATTQEGELAREENTDGERMRGAEEEQEGGGAKQGTDNPSDSFHEEPHSVPMADEDEDEDGGRSALAEAIRQKRQRGGEWVFPQPQHTRFDPGSFLYLRENPSLRDVVGHWDSGCDKKKVERFSQEVHKRGLRERGNELPPREIILGEAKPRREGERERIEEFQRCGVSICFRYAKPYSFRGDWSSPRDLSLCMPCFPDSFIALTREIKWMSLILPDDIELYFRWKNAGGCPIFHDMDSGRFTVTMAYNVVNQDDWDTGVDFCQKIADAWNELPRSMGRDDFQREFQKCKARERGWRLSGYEDPSTGKIDTQPAWETDVSKPKGGKVAMGQQKQRRESKQAFETNSKESVLQDSRTSFRLEICVGAYCHRVRVDERHQIDQKITHSLPSESSASKRRNKFQSGHPVPQPPTHSPTASFCGAGQPHGELSSSSSHTATSHRPPKTGNRGHHESQPQSPGAKPVFRTTAVRALLLWRDDFPSDETLTVDGGAAGSSSSGGGNNRKRERDRDEPDGKEGGGGEGGGASGWGGRGDSSSQAGGSVFESGGGVSGGQEGGMEDALLQNQKMGAKALEEMVRAAAVFDADADAPSEEGRMVETGKEQEKEEDGNEGEGEEQEKEEGEGEGEGEEELVWDSGDLPRPLQPRTPHTQREPSEPRASLRSLTDGQIGKPPRESRFGNPKTETATPSGQSGTTLRKPPSAPAGMQGGHGRRGVTEFDFQMGVKKLSGGREGGRFCLTLAPYGEGSFSGRDPSPAAPSSSSSASASSSSAAAVGQSDLPECKRARQGPKTEEEIPKEKKKDKQTEESVF